MHPIVVRENVCNAIKKPSNLLQVTNHQAINCLHLTLACLLHLPVDEIDALAGLTQHYELNMKQ